MTPEELPEEIALNKNANKITTKFSEYIFRSIKTRRRMTNRQVDITTFFRLTLKYNVNVQYFVTLSIFNTKSTLQ